MSFFSVSHKPADFREKFTMKKLLHFSRVDRINLDLSKTVYAFYKLGFFLIKDAQVNIFTS